jgi:Restriction endonuclease
MSEKRKNSNSVRPSKGATSSGAAPNVRKGKIVEAVVALLHEQPGITIETNVRLPPKHSDPSRKREIDVLITGQIAGYTVRIAFSCKNERGPIKPNLIDEFIGMLDDVGISPEYGIFVCVNGYTSGALARAKDKGIKTLVLRGLTKNRPASEIAKAFQFSIYLLPEVTQVTVNNNRITADDKRQFLIFGNEKQLDEANKWNELAAQTLEVLTTEDSGDMVLSGSLSNQLIDEVLIRTAARFRSSRALQKNNCDPYAGLDNKCARRRVNSS